MKKQLRYRVAEVVRQLLDAECMPRCKIIPFPIKKRPKRRVRELQEQLAQISNKDE